MARDGHLGRSCRRVNLYFRSDGDCLITQRESVHRDRPVRYPPATAYRASADGRSPQPGRWRRLSAWAIMRGHYVARESHSFSVARRPPVMDRWIQLQVIDADVTVVSPIRWRHFRFSSYVQEYVVDDSSRNIRSCHNLNCSSPLT